MKLLSPNYEECITNLACSILKYFEVPYKHNTIKEIDESLKSNPKNVVVILFDGMGYNLINRILKEDSFLRTNMVKPISSISPSTTTASTTSILSGLNPIEHGWLGWDMYIKEENKIITLFKNTFKDTKIQAADYNIPYKYMPYDNLKEQIDKGKYSAEIVFPFGKYIVYHNKSLREMNQKIIHETQKEGKRYIYAYYENPDTILHLNGSNSGKTKRMFKLIDKSVTYLANNLEDTLLIITADHGHIDSSPIIISDYPDFLDTLDGDISIEPRFCSFKVKKEKEFIELFNKYFKDYFILKTKEEIINEHWFGYGKENSEFYNALGDYFAIAIKDKFFLYRHCEEEIIKSHHAGITEDEMLIPLIMKRCN